MPSAELSGNPLKRLQALQRLGLLDTPADPHLDTLTRLARDLFAVKMVAISLIDSDRQWFKSRQGLDVAQTPLSHSYCARAVELDAPLIVEDSQQDPRFAGSELARNTPDVRFYAGWPLRDASGLALGTLCLADATPREFGENEQFQLRDLAYLVESYLCLRHNARQADDLRDALDREQRKAMLDPLTQLWNRAGLLHFLPLQQAAAEQAGQQLGLLFCDLDHFKQVNDHHGHAAGDQVLWQSARRMSLVIRPQDLLTRNGGEEFVLLAGVHDGNELLQIAERLRQTIAAPAMQLGALPWQQTISLGCALLAPGESPSDALARADQALYRAKHNGRNRSELATLAS